MKTVNISQLQEVLLAIEEGKISIKDILNLINKYDEKKDELKPKEFDPNNINLIIDYSRNLKQMIKAGKYAWANKEITEEHFPLLTRVRGKKIQISAKLFYFNRSISSSDVISEMEKEGYRPATLAELLALGEEYPAIQTEFPVVALGFIWSFNNSGRRVTVLRFGGSRRGVHLYWFNINWNDTFRFLAIRK